MIVYIGANGMLGQDFLSVAKAENVSVKGMDLPDMDITNYESVKKNLPECSVVINGAAYTRVDDAERDIQTARRINADGAGNVARVCGERGIRLVHVSTDYVFNGMKGSEYTEDDKPDPVSMYGLTKWEGEVMVRKEAHHAVIARAQSLYGVNGHNFVKAILGQIIKGKRELTVVSDQISSPTYTRHLSEGLLKIAQCGEEGVVHVASRGSCSWHAFAQEIVQLLGISSVNVKPMSASELNYPAPRPPYSVLSTDRFTEWTGWLMPTWREGLKQYLREEKLVEEALAAV